MHHDAAAATDEEDDDAISQRKQRYKVNVPIAQSESSHRIAVWTGTLGTVEKGRAG